MEDRLTTTQLDEILALQLSVASPNPLVEAQRGMRA